MENEDLDKVRNLIENNCQEDDVKEELVRKIVNSRSNKAVTQLLKVNLIDLDSSTDLFSSLQILTEFLNPVDSVDGGNEAENKNYNNPRMKDGLQVSF